jgi:hypothetical protein
VLWDAAYDGARKPAQPMTSSPSTRFSIDSIPVHLITLNLALPETLEARRVLAFSCDDRFLPARAVVKAIADEDASTVH